MPEGRTFDRGVRWSFRAKAKRGGGSWRRRRGRGFDGGRDHVRLCCVCRSLVRFSSSTRRRGRWGGVLYHSGRCSKWRPEVLKSLSSDIIHSDVGFRVEVIAGTWSWGEEGLECWIGQLFVGFLVSDSRLSALHLSQCLYSPQRRSFLQQALSLPTGKINPLIWSTGSHCRWAQRVQD